MASFESYSIKGYLHISDIYVYWLGVCCSGVLSALFVLFSKMSEYSVFFFRIRMKRISENMDKTPENSIDCCVDSPKTQNLFCPADEFMSYR